MQPINLSAALDHTGAAPSLRRLQHSLQSGGSIAATAPDAAKAVTIALVAKSWPGPVLVLAPRPQQADSLAEEITAWLGDSGRLLRFPERDSLPFERFPPAPEAVAQRIRVAAALARSEPLVIVASGMALVQRTISPQQLREGSYRLALGQELDLDAFLRGLAHLGYSIEPLVEEPGQASRRGGIIDVYPPAAPYPLRIELLGRQIESLRLFDPITQRSVATATAADILPATEAPAPASPQGWRLDFSLCHEETTQRFQEEMALLSEGLPFPNRSLYVPFLASATLLDHLPPQALVAIDEEDELAAAIGEAAEEADRSRQESEARGEIPKGLPDPIVRWPDLLGPLSRHAPALRLSRWQAEEGGAVRLPFAGAQGYGGQIRRLASELAVRGRARRTLIVSQQAQRLSELLAQEGETAAVEAAPAQLGHITLVPGSLPAGWSLADDGVGLDLLTDTEIFGFAKQRRVAPRPGVDRDAFLASLGEGAYVVHVDHGIARFAGLVRLTIDGHEREYLELHYAEGDKLYVPTDQLERVSRYIGPSDRPPHLTRLGTGDWQRTKQRVRRAVQRLARDLLALYAAREVLPGHAFAPDSPWQAELEASFPYVETADQMAAIAAVKRDMESPRPMDRLVCGDVGYGKTEVAIRAAFKAVMDGKQVAVLVPTTVLAQQHYRTFRERLAAFPVRIEVLSRFRSEAEQKRIVEELAQGTVDIVIGTHRLLQKDVQFRDLGLLVIDEEQRFGVAHKEHLKKMRREVDVLTLSATPIPRTLYMALGGIRDMSTMETPPEQRLPIKTYISEFDERLLREAIMRELERGGQVYFVHNRVHNIELVAQRIREIVPEARVAVAHGQMDEKALAEAMEEFVEGRTDVLVCTTIIESGLDIPNVNTIIMNQADKLGLAQMYQLRGRVGRGAHRAYAYLLYDRKARLTDAARRRLATIFEATELGAGFQIALRDLEIRGAGNLLGTEQSGFMAAVGFDLYVKLLAKEVRRLRALSRGEPPPVEPEGPEVSIDLPLSAHLPPSYIPDINQRLALYQRLSAAAGPQEVAAIAQEMVDRFGPPPPLARNLLYVVTLRTLAKQAGVHSISAEDSTAVVRLPEGKVLPREPLESTAPRGVHVGHTMLTVELGEGWRERLRLTLEQLAEAARPS